MGGCAGAGRGLGGTAARAAGLREAHARRNQQLVGVQLSGGLLRRRRGLARSGGSAGANRGRHQRRCCRWRIQARQGRETGGGSTGDRAGWAATGSAVASSSVAIRMAAIRQGRGFMSRHFPCVNSPGASPRVAQAKRALSGGRAGSCVRNLGPGAPGDSQHLGQPQASQGHLECTRRRHVHRPQRRHGGADPHCRRKAPRKARLFQGGAHPPRQQAPEGSDRWPRRRSGRWPS